MKLFLLPLFMTVIYIPGFLNAGDVSFQFTTNNSSHVTPVGYWATVVDTRIVVSDTKINYCSVHRIPGLDPLVVRQSFDVKKIDSIGYDVLFNGKKLGTAGWS